MVKEWCEAECEKNCLKSRILRLCLNGNCNNCVYNYDNHRKNITDNPYFRWYSPSPDPRMKLSLFKIKSLDL